MSLEVMGSAQGAYQNIKSQAPQQTSTAEAAAYQVNKPHQAATPVAVSGAQGGEVDSNGKQPTDKDISSAIELANKQARFKRTNAQFAYHEDTKRISIKIIDNDTQEVVKEIPSEETLEMISKLYDLLGMVVDESR